MRSTNYLKLNALVLGSVALAACSSNSGSTGPSSPTGGGGAGTVGGANNAGTKAAGGGSPGGGGVGTTGGAGANVGGSTGNGAGGVATTGGNPSAGGNGNGGAATGGNGNGGAATGGKSGATGGSSVTNVGGSATGGKAGTGVGGGNTGGTSTNGGAATGGKASTGGSGGGNTGGTSTNGGAATGGVAAGGGTGCSNADTSVINEDASGYVCNNTWGIKGAWYCYSDGSDSSISCKGSDGKGAGAIPWNSSSSAMCLSGTMGTGTGSYAGIGFKVNSDPPGSTTTPGTWNASNLVGFAITLTSGASGKGTGGMILNLEYPTSTDEDTQTKDAPGITVPGVAGTSITYNALFSDSVLANNKLQTHPVDPANLTDVKIAFFPDSVTHSYDFCIKSVVPITTKPNPVVATGTYGPTWSNQMPQAVNGINGYAVQSAPFPSNGNPMTMQVSATSGGVGFTYTPGRVSRPRATAPHPSPPSSAAGGPVKPESSSMAPTRAARRSVTYRDEQLDVLNGLQRRRGL